MSFDDYLRSKKPLRAKTPHPYAQLEHRIIDSEAFANLSGSGIRLLTLLIRQITYANNNGHLQATWTYCRKHGFNSQNTLASAIKELIAHGFVYRSRSRGPNKRWARYALTWMPLSKDTEKLFLQGFTRDAWKCWQKHPQKSEEHLPQILMRKRKDSPETDGYSVAITEDYELVPSIANK